MTICASQHPVETLPSIDSTNAEARRRAEGGYRGPLWLRAETQTAGTGRGGRKWHSPTGNLYATLLMPWAGQVADAALVSFVACLAVADTAEFCLSDFEGTPLRNAEGERRVALKWPNDALLDGRKLAGVLLESGGTDGGRWLAIGIGINLAHTPQEARWPPIALAEATDPPSPAEAMGTLSRRFDHWQTRFETEGFAPIRRAWLNRAAHLGQKIEARLPRETLGGIFSGLAEDGTLMLDTPQGKKLIAAADIHFPA